MGGDAKAEEREAARGRVGAVVRALRPQHWIKNLLVLAPLALAHQFSNIDKLVAAMFALAAFCCCASAAYVINDLVDLDADRRHPQKRKRPFASGALPLAWGPPLAFVLVGLALTVAGMALPIRFLGMLVAYLLLAGVYSRWLKQLPLADVLVLSGLFTIRIIAGGAATEVPVSEWLMGFSLFLFLSLAFAKRYSELLCLAEQDATSAKARGYRSSDRRLIENIGPTSGYLAVLVFALYIHSEEASRFYANGWALWLICPLLIYWVSRIWMKAQRGELPEDPVLFAVKDRGSLLVGAAVLVLVALAKPL